MDAESPDRRREALRRRYEAMGLEPRPVPRSPSWRLSLPVEPLPFDDGLGHLLAIASISLVSIGNDRVKCLAPFPLFCLPFVRVLDCTTAVELEARVRDAWRAHGDVRARTSRWLEKLGLPFAPADAAPLDWLPLGVDDARTCAIALAPGRIALPTRGPLAGLTLRRLDDRVLTASSPSTGVDLQILATTRMEELARLHARLARDARPRTPPASSAGESSLTATRDSDDPHRVMLVGKRLAADIALQESLRLRGIDVIVARGPSDALRAFERISPELVLAETQLDRFEGIELVMALRTVPGIEEMPVVLMDDHTRPERREAARQAGAAGYLAGTLEAPRVAAGIADQLRRPRRRRFTRLPARVGVKAVASGMRFVTVEVARGGMRMQSDQETDVPRIDRYTLRLPGPGAPVEVEAGFVHRRLVPGVGRYEVGLRFRRFADGDEVRFVSWLRSLLGDAPSV